MEPAQRRTATVLPSCSPDGSLTLRATPSSAMVISLRRAEGSATNMLGNERYRSYIKLRPGTDIAAVEERLPAFIATFRS